MPHGAYWIEAVPVLAARLFRVWDFWYAAMYCGMNQTLQVILVIVKKTCTCSWQRHSYAGWAGGGKDRRRYRWGTRTKGVPTGSR